MPNPLMLGRRYEAWITDEPEPDLKALQVHLDGAAQKVHELSRSAAAVGA